MTELVSNSRNGLHIYFFKDGLKMKSKFHRITKLSHLATNLLLLPRMWPFYARCLQEAKDRNSVILCEKAMKYIGHQNVF